MDITCVPITLECSFLRDVVGMKGRLTHLEIIHTYGDSMEPFIQDGEMIIFERRDDAKNNDIVVVNINGEVMIKRLMRDPFKQWMRLISDNKFYKEILCEGDEVEQVHIVGIVQAKFYAFPFNALQLLK